MAFGTEIWEWKKWKKIEKIYEAGKIYEIGIEDRWEDLGSNMVREEGKREKMITKLGKMTIEYEEKLTKERGSESTRKC